MASCVLGLLLLIGLFGYGSTILCYECNSATNSFCGDKLLPDSFKRNCSEHDRGITHTLCRKIVQQVDYGVNGRLPESRIVRTCGWDESRYKGKCYHRAGYGGRQEVCSCTTDYCNSGHHNEVTTSVIVTTTLVFMASKILCE